MNDKQIRLQLLSKFYKSAKYRTEPPLTMRYPRLQGFGIQEYNFNCYYLIERGLLIGENLNTRAGIASSPSRISYRGIDIIEKLIETSELELKTKSITLSDKTLTFAEKLVELVVIWSKNPDLYQKAWETLEKLITSNWHNI